MSSSAASTPNIEKPNPQTLAAIADAAGRQIPPLWPLASHVAVNPYLGQADQRLAEAGARLERIGAGSVTLPRAWYLNRLDDDRINHEDIAGALKASPYAAKPASVEALIQTIRQDKTAPEVLPTIADLAATHSGTDWPGLIADRIGIWAGSHFDAGQALWGTSPQKTAWSAYRMYATHDITPEIMGLEGFSNFVVEAPNAPLDAIAGAVERLGLEQDALPGYFHQLLLSLGGWSQAARYALWRAELAEETDSTLVEMLAIRLLWEEALYTQYAAAIQDDWAQTRSAHAHAVGPDEDQIADEIFQEANERAAQRALGETLATPGARRPSPSPSPSHDTSNDDASNDDTSIDRPSLQAAFCIDVRSEVFRRSLESIDPSIQTLGFAGFFGVFAKHRSFASDVDELRLPVLLNPSVQSCATGPDNKDADSKARFRARAKRAWGRFKLAAVSSFAFVEAMGPVYGVKLVGDALSLKSKPGSNDPKPHFQPALDLPSKITAAETVLRAMSLTDTFAPVVLLAGHGASVTNNPFASGLHCGACGGYSGEVNARLLADLLNDREVRTGVAERGIEIPDETLFIAALHDTTTDLVTLYDGDAPASGRSAELDRVRAWLEAAGTVARTERALRLPGAQSGNDIARRALDWAEVRPEWGLAGCKAFIAAPRARTAGRSLEGRAFLHDYDWQKDSVNDFGVLELIMTAPVVVASWISLQYYGSTVAPETFGSGNKLLHNVVGGIGVFEGNGGVMRTGLPWQSVHDGEDYSHEPLRLSVCIEAPRDAMTAILERHESVRALFENRWLHLFALDEHGQLAWRYAGDLSWEPVEPARPSVENAA